MSSKATQHDKRWLISRLKTSGSKRERVFDGDYASTRHAKHELPLEELPSFEEYRQSHKFYNGKINFGLLVRFLRGRVGEDWATLQIEIESRIPTRLKEYRRCVEWFVADKVEWRDGELRDRKDQQIRMKFYVDPDTNTLQKTPERVLER